MHPDLAALARKHKLSPALLADLEILLGSAPPPASHRTLAETSLPIAFSYASLGGDAEGEEETDEHEDVPWLSAAPPEVPRISPRYEDLGHIGQGGMGEVRRVRDRKLNRVLAMKILHAPLLQRPSEVARFLEEAQATAQLQHPNIIPVHDLGRLPDGRVWFTMKEVRGQTLSEVIAEVHASSVERWETAPSGWSLRRLVSAFHAVCQAVAFAHERGVVHRDLKPENTMLGRHGEVYVLDWGLAKLLGRADPEEGTGEPVVEIRSLRSADHATRQGQVAGTPAYMPPEQARGEIHRIDARSDVYALGAMLYEILSGQPPYEGSAHAILGQVLAGPPVPVGQARPSMGFGFGLSLYEASGSPSGLPLPEELVQACERAMSRDPATRYPSAAALADAVQGWLEGSRRREHALAVVSAAEVVAQESEVWARRAAALRDASAALLAGIAPWAPEAEKAPGWAKEDEARAAEQAARLMRLEADETLKAAFQFVPDLPEAHAMLAERYRAQFDVAESLRDQTAMAEARALLETHASALPETHPLRQELVHYLQGDGALTLHTDPPGAEVSLFRYVKKNSRLIPIFERSLGTTPLSEVRLPMGNYLCLLQHPACVPVRYPVEITRHGHWDGVPPGETHPLPVALPLHGVLGPDEIYLPAGWFRAGGDPELASHPALRVWCDALVVDRFPITNAQFIAFLNDLVRKGREEDALRHAPRERAGSENEQGALIYGYEGGVFSLRPDADGDVWLPEGPVLQVDWHSARAYLAWRAAQTGHPWRLPAELEWEKAARGVDGRRYPWGDVLDPSWCRMFASMKGRQQGDFGPSPVDAYPVDVSPCGVRGMGGNVQDWCLDLYDTPSPRDGSRIPVPDADAYAHSRALRVVRGGSWGTGAPASRVAYRNRDVPSHRSALLGFRGVFLWHNAPR